MFTKVFAPILFHGPEHTKLNTTTSDLKPHQRRVTTSDKLKSNAMQSAMEKELCPKGGS